MAKLSTCLADGLSLGEWSNSELIILTEAVHVDINGTLALSRAQRHSACLTHGATQSGGNPSRRTG